jgi:LmbE family N-acetylglucosaminyl deacetylase
MSESRTARVALVIVAHPDDAEFGCAGTVTAWVAAWQHIAATRKQGQRRAGAILGLSNVIFLDYPDGQLLPTLELRRDLVRLLRRYRFTRSTATILTTWLPGRRHWGFSGVTGRGGAAT